MGECKKNEACRGCNVSIAVFCNGEDKKPLWQKDDKSDYRREYDCKDEYKEKRDEDSCCNVDIKVFCAGGEKKQLWQKDDKSDCGKEYDGRGDYKEKRDDDRGCNVDIKVFCDKDEKKSPLCKKEFDKEDCSDYGRKYDDRDGDRGYEPREKKGFDHPDVCMRWPKYSFVK